RGVNLGGLPLGGRRLDLALDGHAGPGVQVLDHRFVIRQLTWGDDLDVALTGAIVEFDETEPAFGVAPRAHPAAQQHLLADRFHTPGVCDGDRVHLWPHY